jgi:hypothetical protein
MKAPITRRIEITAPKDVGREVVRWPKNACALDM